MNESKHTPGPWIAVHDRVLAKKPPKEWKKSPQHPVYVVAQCGTYCSTDLHDERQANAALCASASDLLAENNRLKQINRELVEALRMILPLAEDYLKHAPSHPDNAKLETARALARAEGREKP